MVDTASSDDDPNIRKAPTDGAEKHSVQLCPCVLEGDALFSLVCSFFPHYTLIPILTVTITETFCSLDLTYEGIASRRPKKIGDPAKAGDYSVDTEMDKVYAES